MKLYMIMLGCLPSGRLTEQHDVFFGIANTLVELVPEIIKFWPDTNGDIHIDVWREVTVVENFYIQVVPKISNRKVSKEKLYFLNLGGYKKDQFDEFHYKILTVNKNQSAAIKAAKSTSFYRDYNLRGAPSHIDDSYPLEVDNIYDVNSIIRGNTDNHYDIEITPLHKTQKADKLHIGYLKLNKIK